MEFKFTVCFFVLLTSILGCTKLARNNPNDTSSPDYYTCSIPTNLDYDYTSLTNNSVNLRWDAVPNASIYYIRYGLSSYSTNWISANSYTNSISLTDLQSGTYYGWEVAAYCHGQNGTTKTSDYSTSDYFYTTICSAPSYLYATDITSNSATLNWSDVSAASYFTIRYKKASVSSWSTLTSYSLYVYIHSLSPSTQYQFQVKSDCNSQYSSTETFYTN